MSKIFKYPLTDALKYPEGEYSVLMPKTAKIIAAKLVGNGTYHHGTPTLWAIVDEKEEPEIKRFVVLETGVEMPKDLGPANFISTVFDENSILVFHIFQKP